MTVKKTYLDSCVLIAAFQGDHKLFNKAAKLLDDSDRDFVVSDYVKLETLPKPSFHKKEDEIEFMKLIFERYEVLESSSVTVEDAVELATRYDLTPIDALHASSAINGNVDDFITGENPTKPYGKITEVNVNFLVEMD